MLFRSAVLKRQLIDPPNMPPRLGRRQVPFFLSEIFVVCHNVATRLLERNRCVVSFGIVGVKVFSFFSEKYALGFAVTKVLCETRKDETI